MSTLPRPQAPGPGGPGGIAFPTPGADGAYAGDNYFQYINVPAAKEYEFGFNRGDLFKVLHCTNIFHPQGTQSTLCQDMSKAKTKLNGNNHKMVGSVMKHCEVNWTLREISRKRSSFCISSPKLLNPLQL